MGLVGSGAGSSAAEGAMKWVNSEGAHGVTRSAGGSGVRGGAAHGVVVKSPEIGNGRASR